MTTTTTPYHAPPHPGMGYPAFVEPDPPGNRQTPESSEHPRVDDQLVRPETREEMVRGRMIYAAPAKVPHADHHQVLGFVTGGCVSSDFIASTDLLTRVGPRSDFATDTCIRRKGIDPSTGARYLEELAFEIVSEQSMRHITVRAEDLSGRGVRRIVAIFVKRGEVREWSPERNDWQVLDPNGVLEDPALAEPIPIRALFDQAEADQTVTRALRTKGNSAMRSIESQAEDQGRADASRRVIEALCESFDIRLGPDRRTHLRQLDARQLESLLDRLIRGRRWPE